MKRKTSTLKAVPRTAEVINLSECRHLYERPFKTRQHVKARVLSFRRKGEPRFRVGDIVTPANMKGGKWARVGDVKASGDGWQIRLSSCTEYLAEELFRLVERSRVFKVGDFVREVNSTSSVKVVAVDVDDEGNCALSFDEGREPIYDASFFVLVKRAPARKGRA